MPAFICQTCGTQFAASDAPPAHCPVCEDARQFVGHDGQRWITPEALRSEHHNRIETIEPGLTGIGTEPRFAIGQRALLCRTQSANVLWDCVSLLDDATFDAVRALGGIDIIVASHPHFYAAMVDWAKAFDARILLHAADQAWVMRSDPIIEYWDDKQHVLADELTLIQCGGHFAGSAVLYWAHGADGRGALFTGDTIQVVADRDWVSFMYSYPNLIPLPVFEVDRITAAIAPFAFERLYGGWWHTVVADRADAKVARSARRYKEALAGDFHRHRHTDSLS